MTKRISNPFFKKTLQETHNGTEGAALGSRSRHGRACAAWLRFVLIQMPKCSVGVAAMIVPMRHLLAFFLLILILTVGVPGTTAQVTSNVFRRVLKVRVNAGTSHEGIATAFTIDVDGREYLITAKHVVAGFKDQDKIDIFMNNGWSPLTVKVFRCEDPIDIAVLVPPHQLTVNFELPFDRTKFYFGQDAYFLGFPYGIQTSSVGINDPYPLAIIKRGTISGSEAVDQHKKAGLILLDGYNNPGFSGGPIVYRDLNQGADVMKVLGVVSGFMPEVVPVLQKHGIRTPAAAGEAAKAQPWRIQQNPDGSYFEYVENDTYVSLNTGIVQGFMLEPAIDLIRQHPIGPEAKDLPENQPH